MPNETDEQGTVLYTRCPHCGTPAPAKAGFCPRCGKPLQGTAATPPAAAARALACSKCGKELPPNSKFCGYCGTPVAVATAAPAPPQTARPAAPAPTPPAARVPPRPAPVAPHPPAATPQLAPAVPRPPVPPVPPRPVAPAAPPAARPSVPPPPARPVVPPPPPSPAVGPPVARPAPPSPAAAMPHPAPPPANAPGTMVFSGLHAAKVEATVTEVKPDGTLGKSLAVTKVTIIGRGPADMSYPEDVLLAPQHASVELREGKLMLKDLRSQNGTFLKQREDVELKAGDVFLLGRTLFRFALQPATEVAPSDQSTMVWSGTPHIGAGAVSAKLQRIHLTGEVVDEFKLDKPEITLGRTTGELVFKDDPYMSGAHAKILALPGRFVLQDLRSRNGVYRRIQGEVELHDMDQFFMGEQLFRADIKELEG